MQIMLKLLIISLFLTTAISQKRLELNIEYNIVNACIDKKSNGGVTKALKEECVRKTLKIINKKSYSEIKHLDKKGELEKYF